MRPLRACMRCVVLYLYISTASIARSGLSQGPREIGDRLCSSRLFRGSRTGTRRKIRLLSRGFDGREESTGIRSSSVPIAQSHPLQPPDSHLAPALQSLPYRWVMRAALLQWLLMSLGLRRGMAFGSLKATYLRSSTSPPAWELRCFCLLFS